jgi:hypothetical protein
MANDLEQIAKTIENIQFAINAPFWTNYDFWIGIVIGLASVVFSVMAFVEARRAKRAATEAGKTVKIQTITIELMEISQKLDRMRLDIHFDEARDLLTEISRRIRRIISPFQKDTGLCEPINSLREALDSAKTSLNSVRPSGSSEIPEAPHAVYYAIEGDFASISNFVADLLGLFENKSINFGDDDDNT